jgi:DNA-binding CsgD family transcriptional regulator
MASRRSCDRTNKTSKSFSWSPSSANAPRPVRPVVAAKRRELSQGTSGVGKSESLRLCDVRAAFRLIGDCRDLGSEPLLWQQRMLEGLCELFGVVQAAALEARWARPARATPPISACSISGDPAADDAFRTYNRDVGWGDDPIHRAIERLPGKLVTRTRRDLVSDTSWYRSATFNEYFRAGRIDHQLLSLFQVSDDGLSSIIVLNRALGDRDFSLRERRLLNFFHAELGRLIGGPLASSANLGVAGLSPRLRQTLACLLEGDGEKQVAARLRLSRATVHQYVTALYRHFNVKSRAQLLARAIRRTRQRT